MKGNGGLIGISQNANARANFVLVGPELAKFSQEADKLIQTDKYLTQKHCENTENCAENFNKTVICLSKTIDKFINPFGEITTKLINIVSKSVMSPIVQYDILNASLKGQAALQEFVNVRINASSVNLWAPMSKMKLKLNFGTKTTNG